MMRARRGHKVKNNKGLGVIWRFIRANLKRIIVASVLAVFSAVAMAFIPGQIQAIGDYMQENYGGSFEVSALITPIIIAVTLLVVYGIFYIIEDVVVAKAVGRIGQDIRDALNVKLSRTPISVMDTYQTGDVQSLFMNDVEVITSSILDNLAPAPANVIKLLLLLVLMLLTNVIMTVSVTIATVIGIFLTALVMKKAQPHLAAQQQSIGELNAVIEESISGHMIIKSFHCEADMMDDFEVKNNDVKKNTKKAQFLMSMVQPFLTFNANLGYVAVAVTAAILFSVSPDSLTIGSMAAFILYTPMIADPINAVMSLASSLQQASASAERISVVLDDPEIENLEAAGPASTAARVKGDVTFEHVRFGYLPDQIVLKDLSATVKAGQKVAIVGPTGAGKSTLINLLMRFYEPQGGRILLDGVPITELSHEELQASMGMVLQDTWTFQGTVRDNIIYSTEGVTEEKLKQIVDDCGLTFFVETLPDGLDTVIGEQSDVSAGQRQLLTIARALAKDAPVLILDEATSNVDTRSEALIQKAIDRLTEGRTSFVIAHRLSTIKNADCIFVMKDGDVVEMGRHEELLEQGGLYSELYYSQFDPE